MISSAKGLLFNKSYTLGKTVSPLTRQLFISLRDKSFLPRYYFNTMRYEDPTLDQKESVLLLQYVTCDGSYTKLEGI